MLIRIVPREFSWYLLVLSTIVAPVGICWCWKSTTTRCPTRKCSARLWVELVERDRSGIVLRLAFAGAIMLAALSFAFTSMAASSSVLSASEQQQVASALEEDAEVMSNTALAGQLVGQPPATQAEIIRINTEARPLALQVALLIPILAGLMGCSIRSG